MTHTSTGIDHGKTQDITNASAHITIALRHQPSDKLSH